MPSPKQYRKKPVVIEAMQFTDGNGYDIVTWIRENGGAANWSFFSVGHQFIDILTLEGVMTANLNDLIIKGVKSEFYPCKPDIFSATYDEVVETTK